MFWDQGPFDLEGIAAHCRDQWGGAPVVNTHIVANGGLDYRCAVSAWGGVSGRDSLL